MPDSWSSEPAASHFHPGSAALIQAAGLQTHPLSLRAKQVGVSIRARRSFLWNSRCTLE